MANLSTLPDAFLCLEFFRAGEGCALQFNFFLESVGEFGGGGVNRGFFDPGVSNEKNAACKLGFASGRQQSS